MNDHILKAYKGEIYGIAFFEHFSHHYSDKNHEQLWNALVEVEKLTAKLLLKYLRQSKEQIQYDSNEIKQNGIRDAEKWINLPWLELISTLIVWVKPYEEKYISWATKANNGLAIFNIIADHETAILLSLKNEEHGVSGISYLTSYIELYSNIKI